MDSGDEILICLAGTFREAVDRLYRTLGDAQRPQIVEGDVTVFDHIVKHADDLLVQIIELQTTPPISLTVRNKAPDWWCTTCC